MPPGAFPGWAQIRAGRCWLNEAKQEGLTVHETQLVVDKTQHHIHDGAELWGERWHEVLEPELGAGARGAGIAMTIAAFTACVLCAWHCPPHSPAGKALS